MGISQYDPAAAGKPAWNAGKQVGAKRALKIKQVWSIRFFLDREGRMRDRALFDLTLDSKLRGCDLVNIKIGTLVVGQAIRSDQWWSNKRQADQSSSKLPQTRWQACWLGLSVAEAA